MMFKRISVSNAHQLIQAGNATIVDIRDPESFQQGHIPAARLLNQDNLPQFLASAERQLPLLVCCYHGNSSQPAAAFLADKGFVDVYSIDGGFEEWRRQFEVERS